MSKIFVIGIALIITSFGIYGNMLVKIEFDYVKFLPEKSNLAQWFQVHMKYYPSDGYRGEIYFAKSDIKT